MKDGKPRTQDTPGELPPPPPPLIAAAGPLPGPPPGWTADCMMGPLRLPEPPAMPPGAPQQGAMAAEAEARRAGAVSMRQHLEVLRVMRDCLAQQLRPFLEDADPGASISPRATHSQLCALAGRLLRQLAARAEAASIISEEMAAAAGAAAVEWQQAELFGKNVKLPPSAIADPPAGTSDSGAAGPQ